MAVLTAILDVKHHGTGLIPQPQGFFGAVDIVHVLIAGQRPLRGIRVDRHAVEIFLAPGQCFGLHLPFLEGSMQITGNGSSQFGHLRQLIVVGVHQVGGEVLTAAALRGKRDHSSLPKASMR
ncbi:hypothetical protein D9M73_185460 [compost metagenome]